MSNLQLCLANVNELQKLSMKCEIQSTQCCVNQINNVRYLIRRESCIYIALQYCSFFSFDFEETCAASNAKFCVMVAHTLDEKA